MLMVKKQKQLQDINTQLIEIRKLELRYYYNFFLTFGDVGALLTGFLFGTITQILGEVSGLLAVIVPGVSTIVYVFYSPFYVLFVYHSTC